MCVYVFKKTKLDVDNGKVLESKNKKTEFQVFGERVSGDRGGMGVKVSVGGTGYWFSEEVKMRNPAGVVTFTGRSLMPYSST